MFGDRAHVHTSLASPFPMSNHASILLSSQGATRPCRKGVGQACQWGQARRGGGLSFECLHPGEGPLWTCRGWE